MWKPGISQPINEENLRPYLFKENDIHDKKMKQWQLLSYFRLQILMFCFSYRCYLQYHYVVNFNDLVSIDIHNLDSFHQILDKI